MAVPSETSNDNERERPYNYDTDPWHFFSSTHVKFFLGVIVGAIFLTILLFYVFGFGNSGGSKLVIDPNFGKKFNDKIALPSIKALLSSKDKGDIVVTSILEVVGHYLKSQIQITAKFPTSKSHVLNETSLKPMNGDLELGKTINSLHQRIIMRRLGTAGVSLEDPLEFRDFYQTSQEKCACSESLIDKSFVSIKYITFSHQMSLEDKVAFIRKNQSFAISSLPAIPKTGIINATRLTMVSQKYLNCPADYQTTEIVKLIPPIKPDSQSKSFSLDQILCYLNLFSGDPSNTENISCSSASILDHPKPSPMSCRHVSVEVKDYELRNIPDTVISALFCH